MPIAQDILPINVAKINGIRNGMYSLKMMLPVFEPLKIAVYVKSLSLRLSTWDLITLASQAHPKIPSNNPSPVNVKRDLAIDETLARLVTRADGNTFGGVVMAVGT